jgi:hypothetical protein
MTIQDEADWKSQYIPGKSEVIFSIPVQSIDYITDRRYYEDYGTTNSKEIKDWRESMKHLIDLVNEDLKNVDNCINYIQKHFPNAIFRPGYYAIEIDGLTDDEIFQCASAEKLLFYISIDNLPDSQTDSTE